MNRKNHGFYRIAAAVPKVKVADCWFNVKQIQGLIKEAAEKSVEIVCFPELSVTAYTCADLFLQKTLTDEAEKALQWLIKETENLSITFIVGIPVEYNSKLYNCAVVCREGKIYGIVPKVHLPNYSEFCEKRWFEPYSLETPVIEINYCGNITAFGTNLLFINDEVKFAIEISEDLWSIVPPSSNHAMAGANTLFNLAASNELVGKREYALSLISQQSARCHAAYIFASAGFGESSTDLVYAGNAFIYENGKALSESEKFQFDEQLIINEIDIELLEVERKKNTTFISRPVVDNYHQIPVIERTKLEAIHTLTRYISPTPFISGVENYIEMYEDIFSIQVSGLAKRIIHTNAKSLVIGISGGLDSTLALLVCIKTIDKLKLPREMILGITMPGFGTTNRSYTNAVQLMKALGITSKEISIVAACEQHFKDIGHDPSVHDVIYENAQARERTQILMDIANQTNGLVVGTGDLSELALGWATYNGDHMSMYGVNAGIPKTLVSYLVRWMAFDPTDDTVSSLLSDIVDTPVSPELLPVDAQGQTAQFTEELVGPYELHDFFLFYTLRYGFRPAKIFYLAQNAFQDEYSGAVILKWMNVFFRRFFSQQFKRSCMPDGPKVGSVSLSPRGDWRMPSDASAEVWLKEIEDLGSRI